LSLSLSLSDTESFMTLTLNVCSLFLLLYNCHPVEPCLRPTLHLCVLKREEGESFNFHLRVEKGCLGRVIRHVTPCGVVERGGLRDGDRLLEVNAGFVDDMIHPKWAFYVVCLVCLFLCLD
uniref:PDZ domain-containing protein n=1 Tax=Oncorhynchus tshawytscha TaxID=74940 RepID=A0A8C8EVX8_ONCTS